MFYRARRRLESRRGKHECSRHVVEHALFACRLGTLAETFGIRSLRTHLTKLSDIAQECVRHALSRTGLSLVTYWVSNREYDNRTVPPPGLYVHCFYEEIPL